mgnify:CR=1 FL=1
MSDRDQPRLAGRARLRHQRNVAGMQEIEAAVGEHDPLAGRAVGHDQFIWVPGTQSALYLLLTALVESVVPAALLMVTTTLAAVVPLPTPVRTMLPPVLLRVPAAR